MTKRIVLVIAGLLIAGCATSSGVLPMGQDTFLISKKAGTSFGSSTTERVEAIQEANQYCAAGGKQTEVISSKENPGPYIFGNYPGAEVQFKCVGADRGTASAK